MNKDTNQKTSGIEDSSGAETTVASGGQKELDKPNEKPKEYGGRSGPEPTRYGDWEKNGIISDF